MSGASGVGSEGSGVDPRRRMLVVPDCGVVAMPLEISLWLVPEGARVLDGERVVELLAGGGTIDLEAPVTGRLLRQLVDEDEPVTPGMPIALFEAGE